MKLSLFIGIILLFISANVGSLHAQGVAELIVKVTDPRGTPITLDSLRISIGGEVLSCSTQDDFIICGGDFDENAVISIKAVGFDDFEINIAELKIKNGLVKLTPSGGVFGVNVYSDSERGAISTFGMSQVTVRGAELRQTAATVLDDALRQVAGFSTFRRTSGRQANPTTQGVSLRGVGSSGASRTSVLEDGVPLNDPFGGWVQWNRVVQPLLSEVEILRGGASGLYGNSAISGAVILRPLDRRDGRFSADLFSGSQKTIGANGRMAEVMGRFLLLGGFSSLRTRGFIPTEEAVRGSVDSPAGARYDAAQFRIKGQLSDDIQILFKPSIFGEVRTNGTGLQTNRTHSRSILAGIEYNKNNFGMMVRFHGSNQVYDQTFSTIASNRNSETLNRIQRVPSRAMGVSASSTYTISQNFLNALNVGIDWRKVRGTSDEIGIVSGIPNIRTGVGGHQDLTSVFLNNRFAKSGMVISVSLRGDFWRNSDGISVSTPVATGIGTVLKFTDTSGSEFSGRGGISYQATSRINIFASASKSFRVPTLNELYRGFRVGSVVTLPNENLLPEQGDELDAGLIYSTSKFRIRGSLFRNSISDSVSNITLSSTTSLITRQRRNVGNTISQGLEVEAEGRLADSFVFSGGYLFADARIREFPSNALIVGKRIPQVARHQMTFQVRWNPGRFVFSKQIRISGPQFDDDLNVFRLESFLQSDLFLSYEVRENLRIFSGIENVFNTRYSTAKTPLRSIGPPVSVRIGIRWN